MPEDLRTLSDQLRTAMLVLKAKSTYSEIDRQHNILKICKRLGAALNTKWRDRVFSIKKDRMRYPNFEEFALFIREQSDRANDPIYGECSSPIINRATPARTVTNSATVRVSRACVVCEEDHPLFKCPVFRQLDHDKRVEVVTNHNVCENCLLFGHKVEQCRLSSFCRLNTCKEKHSYFLHQVVNNSVHVKYSKNVVMPIVCGSINKQMKVRCLLDTGSTSSFIYERIVSKLNLPCSKLILMSPH